jgi:hypothetical protein
MSLTGTVMMGLFLVAFGFAFFLRVRREVRDGRASMGWSPAIGIVESSDVVAVKNPEGGSGFRPDIRYRYSVGGTTYHADVVSYTLRAFVVSRATAEKHVARYPVGSTVVVHHDPGQPGTAVLEPGVPPHGKGSQLIGAVFIALGIGALIAAIRLASS